MILLEVMFYVTLWFFVGYFLWESRESRRHIRDLEEMLFSKSYSEYKKHQPSLEEEVEFPTGMETEDYLDPLEVPVEDIQSVEV